MSYESWKTKLRDSDQLRKGLRRALYEDQLRQARFQKSALCNSHLISSSSLLLSRQIFISTPLSQLDQLLRLRRQMTISVKWKQGSTLLNKFWIKEDRLPWPTVWIEWASSLQMMKTRKTHALTLEKKAILSSRQSCETRRKCLRECRKTMKC